ncbi:MAG: hypothetical protein MUF83_10080 [Acidimicrobiales bacterium]|jgi:hypothetical protein|nr:hypothetical protein [Acidimicrobiales bacterium]
MSDQSNQGTDHPTPTRDVEPSPSLRDDTGSLHLGRTPSPGYEPPSEEEIVEAAHEAAERFETLVEEALEVELVTGKREETVEQAQRHLLFRVGRITVGALVLSLGLALLALPGPGLVVVALGLGILSQDVPFAKRLLDKVRERLPEDEDGGFPTWLIVGSVCLMVLGIAGSIWWYVLR